MYANSLREQLGKLSVDMTAIISAAKKENNRGLTSDEATAFDKLAAEYERVEASVTRAEKSEDIVASLQKAAGGAKLAPTELEAIQDKYRTNGNAYSDKYEEKFWNFFRKEGKVENDDISFLSARLPQTILNTMSTTTGSQGGFVIPQGFSNQLEINMKWFGGMGICGSFTTDTGNAFPWPTSDDTTNMGEIIGQNTQVSNVDAAFGQVLFGSYIFSSKLIKVPVALLQDSYFDLPGYFNEILGIRIGRLQNNKMTIGSGTGEPTGIVTAAVSSGNIYTMPTGFSTGLNYDQLVNIEHSVDPAYRDTSTWMFHDSTLKALKLLKDASNRPLWQPGLTASFREGAGVNMSKPMILDHPYVINNDMPVMAANATSILFGDMSKYKVRNIVGESTFTFQERFMDYLQKGFLAWLRRDGNLLDAGTHPVAVGKNSAT